jgi:DnaK suppressor protein
MSDRLDFQQIRKKLEEERLHLFRSLQGQDSSLESLESPDMLDIATFLEFYEVRSSLDELNKKKIERINQALARLENGTYGTCLNCGEAISAERLEALPYAELCINCQSNKERKPYETVKPERSSSAGESMRELSFERQ